MATSDKHHTSGICVGTEIGSNTDEISGVQMILEAAGKLEESNVASQSQVSIGSTSSEHFSDYFSGDDRSHLPSEVDESFHAPKINTENLVSDHLSPGGSSGDGAANPSVSTSPSMSNHPSDEPNRIQYVATEQIARNLCK